MDLAREESIGHGIGEVLRLSWPAGLSMLNRTAMQFVDGLMVSGLGPTVLSAQLIGSLTALVPESFATGTLTVVNTYVSQNLGAGRRGRCGQYVWAGLWLALAACAIVAPMALLGGPLFRALGHVEQGLEAMYFRYMLLSIFLTLPARVIEQFFYGVHRPRTVLAASLVANAFNVLADYTLIFGKFGFPAWGLEGAAIGTVVSWGLQLAILAGVFFSAGMNRQYGTRRVFSASLGQVRELVRIGYPAGLGFLNDILPWTVFMAVLVGAFGPAHRAASTIAMRYMPLSFMPVVGISIAATAVVGRYIGQGRKDLARRRAHAAVGLGIAYMSACGLAFFLFRYPLVRLFVNESVSAEVSPAQTGELVELTVRLGTYVMICAAVFQFFDALGIVYIGALRGAGDTFWPMVLTAATSWSMIIGGGYLMVRFVPQWGSIGPWITASACVVVLGVLMARRFESGVWQKINLLGPMTAPEPPPPSDVPKAASIPATPEAKR